LNWLEAILVGIFLALIPEGIKYRRLGRHIRIEDSKEFRDAEWDRHLKQQEDLDES
jgi:hypothetical protein